MHHCFNRSSVCVCVRAGVKGEWVCRFFQSIMNNGVTSLHFDLMGVSSNYQINLQQLECMTATMETHHVTPQLTKVSIISRKKNFGRREVDSKVVVRMLLICTEDHLNCQV